LSRLSAIAFFVVAVLMSVEGKTANAQAGAHEAGAQTVIPDSPSSSPVASSISTRRLGVSNDPPENPMPRPMTMTRKVIDKKFVAVMGALGATESMRFTTRQLVLENEMSAGAPWVTSVPSHTHLVLKYAPIFGTELLVAYALKQPHEWLPGDRVIRKLWWVYPAAMAAIHLHNALGNINTQAPAGAGCTSVAQCQQP
jgi:hypothetical protein